MQNLPFIIRSIREMRNLTQEYVADQLEISVKTYCRLESSKAPFSVEKLFRLAQVLGLSIDEILRFNPDTRRAEPEAGLSSRRSESLQVVNTMLTERVSDLQKEKDRLLNLLENLLASSRPGVTAHQSFQRL